jgi:hypothetical protein
MRMPAIEPGSQAWEACMADAATLHAPRQVYPCPCTLTGSLLNDIRIIVHDHGELQMHLLGQSEYGASRDSRMPRTPDAFPAQAMRPDGHTDADVRRSCCGRDKPNVDTFTFALQPGVMPPRSALIRQCLSVRRSAQQVCTPNAPACGGAQNAANFDWPRGVAASTLDLNPAIAVQIRAKAFANTEADLTALSPCTMHVAVLRTHRPRMFTGAALFWQEHVHENKIARYLFKCLLILHQPRNPAFHTHVLAKFAQRL